MKTTKNPKTPCAVVYARVSTDEQASTGTSLESQLAACLAKAESIGARVAATYDDAGVSGAFYATRPGLQSALALIDEGRADALIVANVSRLSRDTEHQAVIQKRVRAAGGRIVFCDMDFADTPEGDLSMGVFGQFAQYERQLIKSRTTKGRRKRAEEGVQPARTLSPYGYYLPTHADALRGAYTAAEVGKYLVIEDRARWIREAFARCAAGESLRSITRYLADMGAPTPRGGATWHQTSLLVILRNPIYKGVGVYGKMEVLTDERRKTEQGFKRCTYLRERAPEQWQTFAVPALVSEDLWNAVQERLDGNRERLSGNPTRRYLLSGVAKCALCGRSMTGFYSKWGLYYRCKDANQKRKDGVTDCMAGCIRLDELEPLVLRGLLAVAEKPEILTLAIEEYRARRHGAGTPTDADRAAVEAELTALDRRERATISAQIAGIAAGARPEFYAAEFEEIARLRAALEARKKAFAPAPVKDTTPPEQAADTMRRALTDLRRILEAEEISVQDKHALLTKVIEKVVPESKFTDGGLQAVTLYAMPPTGTEARETVQRFTMYWRPVLTA
jgi:Site-specific recombinases, DNA invertase Pin homologs